MAKMVASWEGQWVEDGDWNKIVQLLERGRKGGDIFSIDNLSPKPGEAERLSIEFDEETSIFMPVMVPVDVDKPLLQYDNLEAEGKLVEFAGADMADRYFTDDFDLVVSMVREFYETGWVKALKNPEDMEGKLPPPPQKENW